MSDHDLSTSVESPRPPERDRACKRQVASNYDAVVVGASIAGCTAATLLARQGANVALVERQPDANAHRVACTHFIQSSSVPTLERLGALGPLEELGAARTSMAVWTRSGWIRPPAPPVAHPPFSINIRRSKLDPLLRDIAGGTPGVDLILGRTVDGLLSDDAQITGVQIADRSKRRQALRARLVVAADGRRSAVAQLAGLAVSVHPNHRFGYWAYFRDVQLPDPVQSQIWMLDPNIAFAFHTDDGLTMLACSRTKDHLPAFRRDTEAGLLDAVTGLPDGPEVLPGQRVSRVIGKLDQRSISRPPTAPGLALIGDAALTSDSIWGVGCGFALQSAEWLSDATAEALVNQGDTRSALAAYRRRHRKELKLYDLVMRGYSSGRQFNALERLIFTGAANDEYLAARSDAFGTRNVKVTQYLTPRTLIRAARVSRQAKRYSRSHQE
jgi:2-polyprenyl-6-methoxyphenol hydroxylase-like FAD-dependent oxidoreductase